MNRARVAQLFRTIADASAELARELGADAGGDEWIDQDHSPLGKRAHLDAVRAGKLPGYKPNRRRVLVRQKDIDAYIAKRPSKSKTVAAAQPAGEVTAHEHAERVSARLGLVRTGR